MHFPHDKKHKSNYQLTSSAEGTNDEQIVTPCTILQYTNQFRNENITTNGLEELTVHRENMWGQSATPQKAEIKSSIHESSSLE